MNEKPCGWMWIGRAIGYFCEVRISIAALLQRIWNDRTRGLLHLGVLLLLVLVLSLGEFVPGSAPVSRDVISPLFPTQTPISETQSLPTADRVLRYHATTVGRPAIRRSLPVVEAAFQSPIPLADDPLSPRTGVITYTVRAGDHLASIAARFRLERETLIWSNAQLEQDPGMLYIGQVLDILPVDGVYYTVQEGDTLASIADRFLMRVEAIANSEYNTVREGLSPGQKLVIPGGTKPFQSAVIPVQATPSAAGSPQGGGSFVWPVGGYISQGYWNLHRAIDIAGKHGDVVIAMDAGTVVYASWDVSGYGNLVIVDHGNGYTSYYAHLYGFYVDVGEQVTQGQPLGALGDTGRSTGPHVHLEIRQGSVYRNPLGLLPAE